MPTKIFTTIDGNCPFGLNVKIDSKECRTCANYYRSGTGMFFWCNHPPGPEKPKRTVRPKPEPADKKKKRGETPKKGKESRIKVIKQSKR